MGKIARVFIFISLLLMTSFFSEASALEIGDKAPEFSLPNVDGEMISLSDFKGNVIILDFFATWCPHCRKELPGFIELHEAYGDKGLAVIGIASVSAEEAKDCVDEFDINFPVLIDDNESVSDLYGPVDSIPTTFLVDKKGKIVKIYEGFTGKDDFENDLKELLEQ